MSTRETTNNENDRGAAFEAMAGDPFGHTMNNMRKYVVCTTLESADAWRNSILINDDVVETVRRLKQEPGQNILVDGSSVLIQTLVQHDLMDEYTLHVYPIVLGSGKRIFKGGARHDFTLVETKLVPTSVVTCDTAGRSSNFTHGATHV